MRKISRERVSQLARDLLDAMVRTRSITLLKDREAVQPGDRPAIADEFRREEEREENVRRRIATIRKPPARTLARVRRALPSVDGRGVLAGRVGVVRAQRFFRYLWRVNAVLIAIAAAGIAVAVVMLTVSTIQDKVRRREAAAASVIPGKPANKELSLSGLLPIEGTSIFRATLSSEHYGKHLDSFSSGEASEIRNILFVDTTTGTAAWLLPSDKERITNQEDVTQPGEHKPPLAIVALVKPDGENTDAATGRLLIVDVAGRHVEQFASDVHALDGVTITPGGDIAVLFQKNRKYYLASFDRTTRAKRSEREIAVPDLH